MSKQVEVESGGSLSYDDALYLQARPQHIADAKLQGVDDIDEQIEDALKAHEAEPGEGDLDQEGGPTGEGEDEPDDEFKGLSRPKLVQLSKDAELPANVSNAEMAKALRDKKAADEAGGSQ